jgi:hypothetical protein
VNLEVRTTWLNNSQPANRDTVSPTLRSEFILFDSSYTDVEVNGARQIGRFDFNLISGARFGSNWGQQQWAYGVIAMPLFGRLGLAASGGWRPAQPERAQRGGRFAMLSLLYRTTRRQTSAPLPETSPVLHSARTGEDRYLLTLTLPKARSVRIKGDLTNWEPVSLQRVEGSVWQIELPAVPGIYKINLSINDGSWIVPAGLIEVADGFGGKAGVINLN